MRTIVVFGKPIVVSIFAALALVLVGSGSSTGAASSAIRVLAIGDFGVGGETQRATGEAVRQYEAPHAANTLLTLGDNDYTESPSAFAANWAASFGWTGPAGVRVAGTLGNHDVVVDRGRYQFALLGMPGRYYRRRIASVELFVLDSTNIDVRQTSWLRRSLARSTARWKVASFHHPAYTCGAYRGDARVRAAWVPLFERFGVRLALSGHDHNYQRFASRRGVTYVVHGGGGARLYPLARCPAGYPRRVAARSAHGFLSIVADRARLEIRSVEPSGRTIDRFVLRRRV